MFAREESQNEELKSVESALRSLAPAPTSVDRDRLMYLAGQSSVRPVHGSLAYRWRWPSALAASVMLAALLGRVTAPERVHVVDRVVQIPIQAIDQASEDIEQFEALALSDGSQGEPSDSAPRGFGSAAKELPFDQETLRPYIRLRDQIVAMGPDMLPALGGSQLRRRNSETSYIEIRHDLVQ